MDLRSDPGGILVGFCVRNQFLVLHSSFFFLFEPQHFGLSRKGKNGKLLFLASMKIVKIMVSLCDLLDVFKMRTSFVFLSCLC